MSEPESLPGLTVEQAVRLELVTSMIQTPHFDQLLPQLESLAAFVLTGQTPSAGPSNG